MALANLNEKNVVNFVVGFADASSTTFLREAVLGWDTTHPPVEDTLLSTRHLVAITNTGEVVGVVSSALIAFPDGNGANFGEVRALRLWGFAVNPQYSTFYGVEESLLDAAIQRGKELAVSTAWAHIPEGESTPYKNSGFTVFPSHITTTPTTTPTTGSGAGMGAGVGMVRVARQLHPEH